MVTGHHYLQYKNQLPRGQIDDLYQSNESWLVTTGNSVRDPSTLHFAQLPPPQIHPKTGRKERGDPNSEEVQLPYYKVGEDEV